MKKDRLRMTILYFLFILILMSSFLNAFGQQIPLCDYSKISKGMSEAEVLVRLGPPDQLIASGHNTVRRYHYFSEARDLQNITVIIEFWDGKVYGKERIIN